MVTKKQLVQFFFHTLPFLPLPLYPCRVHARAHTHTHTHTHKHTHTRTHASSPLVYQQSSSAFVSSPFHSCQSLLLEVHVVTDAYWYSFAKRKVNDKGKGRGTLPCKRRNFCREFNFCSFRIIEKVRTEFPYQIFFHLACRPFDHLFLFLLLLSHSREYEIKLHTKGFGRKVWNFLPPTISSFSVIIRAKAFSFPRSSFQLSFLFIVCLHPTSGSAAKKLKSYASKTRCPRLTLFLCTINFLVTKIFRFFFIAYFLLCP